MSDLHVLLLLLSLSAASIDPPKKAPTKKGALSFTVNNSGGIGASVMIDSKTNVIKLTPFARTPASAAGIRAGDTLLAVDGVSVSGQSMPTVVSRIRGRPGTTVKLRVRHRGQKKPKVIQITRRPMSTILPPPRPLVPVVPRSLPTPLLLID